MPYNLPQVQMPDMVGAFQKGRKISLSDYAREQKENESLMQNASQAANWAMSQPDPQAAFERAISFEEQQNPNWGKLRGAPIDWLASGSAKAEDIERFGAVHQGVLPDGGEGFFQVGSRSTVKPVVGVKPIDKESKKTSEILKREKGKYTIKISTEPELQAAITKSKAEAKDSGVDIDLYKNMKSNMPGLHEVVGNLRELAEVATYTKGGRAYDAVTRELGFSAPKGATARAKFISTVNNEILPLLKQTFGAAFTFQEGESLKATLGSPDLSPEEKQVELDAFIESKVRQMRSLERKLGINKKPTDIPEGYTLMTDADGNKAYVSPDKTDFIEVK